MEFPDTLHEGTCQIAGFLLRIKVKIKIQFTLEQTIKVQGGVEYS